MLTNEDIDLLLEGLEAWKSRDMAGEMMGGIMTIMTSGPEDMETIHKRLTMEMEKRQEQRKAGNERALMLQAKLITLRDKLAVDSIIR